MGDLQAGQLDAGFFYGVEASAAHLRTVPLQGTQLAAQYTVAILNRAPHEAAAKAFVKYLLSAAGRSILERYGVTALVPSQVSRAPHHEHDDDLRDHDHDVVTFSGARRSPLLWLGGLLVVYLGYPLVAFVVRLITSPQRGFHEPGLFPALWVSVSGATVSLAIVTVLGVPLAYLLARSTGPISTIVGTVVQIPLALPPLMSGIVLVYLIGPYTFLGQLFGEHLTNSFVGVVIAMTFVSSPFLIVSSRAAFASLDRGMLDVAAALGHADAVTILSGGNTDGGPRYTCRNAVDVVARFRRVRGRRDTGLQPRVVAHLYREPIQWPRSAHDVGPDGARARRGRRRGGAQSGSRGQTRTSTSWHNHFARARDGDAAACSLRTRPSSGNVPPAPRPPVARDAPRDPRTVRLGEDRVAPLPGGSPGCATGTRLVRRRARPTRAGRAPARGLRGAGVFVVPANVGLATSDVRRRHPRTWCLLD